MIETQLLSLPKYPAKNETLSSLHAFYLRHFAAPCFPIIHIAGTNGKGSVSTKIRYAYEMAGKKTGLFTSPHVTTLRERIQIGGEIIDEESFAKAFTAIDNAVKKEDFSLCFFSFIFLMGLYLFSVANIAIGILEAGIGGRLDPTNIFPSVLSIITQIDYDHMEILGNTLDKIAYEKAGIIKENIPVLLGPKAHFSRILLQAATKKSPVLFTPDQEFSWYDEENTLIAKTALQHLQCPYQGIENIRPVCRFEQIKPFVILDVAHNESGFIALFSALYTHFPNKKFRFFLCLAKGKIIPQKFPPESFVHIAALEHPQLRSLESIRKTLVLFTKHTFCTEFSRDFLHAYRLAKKQQEVLVVAGSFYMMHAVRALLELEDSSFNSLSATKDLDINAD